MRVQRAHTRQRITVIVEGRVELTVRSTRPMRNTSLRSKAALLLLFVSCFVLFLAAPNFACTERERSTRAQYNHSQCEQPTSWPSARRESMHDVCPALMSEPTDFVGVGLRYSLVVLVG